MVQFAPQLPARESFGSGFLRGLGGGIEQGTSKAMELYGKKLEEEYKQKRKKELLDSVFENGPREGLEDSATQARSTGQRLSQPMQSKTGTGDLSDKQIAAITLEDPQFGKILQDQKKAKRKTFESDRAYHSSRSNKFLDEVAKETKGIPEREVAVNSAIEAVQSGQMSPMGGDFWANVLNVPQLKSESGGTLQSAAKVNLMGSLGKIGARPNQFIEKQINDAFAQAGEKPGVQMAKLNIAKTVLDLDKKHGEIARNIANQYREDLGYVPENIDSLVEAQMKPYAKQRMEKLSYDLQEGREKSQPKERFNSLNEVAAGTPLTEGKYKVLFNKAKGNTEEERDAAAIRMAKKAGYKIVDDNILLSSQ
jgi:hypothetical protein